MAASELREKNVGELLEQLSVLKKEKLMLRFQRAGGESVRPHRFKEIRRDVARIETVLREKQASGGSKRAQKTLQAKVGPSPVPW